MPVSPRIHSPPHTTGVGPRALMQEQDTTGDISDDDRMVICEDATNEIDLKCKEKVTDSDSESQSDLDSSLENRMFQRVSPVTTNSCAEVTCRPKPIKAKMPSSDTPKYSPVASSSSLSFHFSPVNPSGVTGFQPTGGAFKTMPASPKVVKNEINDNHEMWSGTSIINKTNDVSQWINSSSIQTSSIQNKTNPTLAILKPPIKPNVIQMNEGINQNYPSQPLTVFIGGQPTICLSNDSERSQPFVVVASTASDIPLQVYMPSSFSIPVSDTNGRSLSLQGLQLLQKPSSHTQSVIVTQAQNKACISSQSEYQSMQSTVTSTRSYNNTTGELFSLFFPLYL